MTANSKAFDDANDGEALFGVRYKINGNPVGAMNASVLEAKIFDTTLTQAKINALEMTPVAPVPLLAGLILLLAGLGTVTLLRRRQG
ncbi:hypothetical protein [Actibacterium sp. 188UL27-1]|uniref:hypothetical protein n=1 Tax=Actibacterium sp. 188UL27-1 TaxID=2786961 RepID=UPI00195CB217|nr:hypothetical protein [Actibacterium sp. 188UL27-1]MBM7066545.1 hypothetical protein [Actibacterium sp. 188UL27-1]